MATKSNNPELIEFKRLYHKLQVKQECFMVADDPVLKIEFSEEIETLTKELKERFNDLFIKISKKR